MSNVNDKYAGRVPMKIQRYIAVLLLLAFMVVGASAYEMRIYAPQSLKLGETIVVNGTTSLPAGMSFDIRLTRFEHTSEVKGTKHVIVQGDKNFTVEFPTIGYTRGIYKVETLPAGVPYLGNSITMRVVTLIDRSDEIVLTPPLQKVYDGFLTIAGNGAGLINSGVKVIVTSSNGTLLFGPEFIPSDYMGYFSKTFPIPGPGNYSVNISDAHGFIGNFTYTITKHQETQTTPITPTSTPTPNPTSATSVASRDKPAIFVVYSNPGPVRIYTSTGIDWDLEYLDRNGTIHKVHETGSQYPESVTFPSDGNTTRVTVYPYMYEDNNKNVTLYAENATDIQIFNTTPPTPMSTPKSSLPWLLFIVAIGLILMIKRK